MRVVVNGRFLTQPLTGVQRYAREVVRALDALIPDTPGLEIELLTPKLNAIGETYRNIRVRQVGRLRGHAWEQLELPRWVGRSDVLFCPANTAPASALIGNYRVVATVHDLSYRYFPKAYSLSFRLLYNLLIPLIMRRAKRVITVSDAERTQILSVYPWVRERIVVVPNGGAPAPPITETEDLKLLKPYALYVGSFTKRKNFPALMAAANRLLKERPDLRFIFVGGSPKIFVAAEVDPSIVHERMIFKGQIEDTPELQAYYASAEVFVFPSLYESSGLPPTEAMACGCPVVVSQIPALVERCGDAAVYCDPQDQDSMLGAIRRVLDNRELREALVAKGLERSRMFSWAGCAKDTLNALSAATGR